MEEGFMAFATLGVALVARENDVAESVHSADADRPCKSDDKGE